MVFRRSRQAPGSRKATVYPVLVHATLVLLLVVGVRWQAQPQAPAPVIQARVLSEADTRKDIEQRRRAEQERVAAARQQRELEERTRRAAADQRREEQARAEQKRKVEAEKQRKVQEQRAAEARARKETEERRKAAETGLKGQVKPSHDGLFGCFDGSFEFCVFRCSCSRERKGAWTRAWSCCSARRRGVHRLRPADTARY